MNEQDERGAFDIWARERFPAKHLSTNSDSRAMDEAREFAWEGWQARAASTSANKRIGGEMIQRISGFLFDLEMREAGFTPHEISNQRLRNAAYRLLVRGQLYRFDDADEIEYGVSGPFNDDERAAQSDGDTK